jgi:hypothetical protein
MWRSWGIDPDEATRAMPGDDLVEDPSVMDTRGITIDAPPKAVWPWLVQMGYGRAGWYSYDAMDMRGKSIRSIVPEWQSIAVGDLIHTDPDGGFHVKVVEPGRALVLYVDTSDVKARSTRRHERKLELDTATPVETVPAGVALSGGLLAGATSDTFSASWAFVLEPLEGGRTRLIERYRVAFGEPVAKNAIAGPALSLGVFIMTRRQMLGIRERVEELHRARHPLETEKTEPATAPKTRPMTEPMLEAMSEPMSESMLEAMTKSSIEPTTEPTQA